jgi:circadian clock protein KaiC
VEYKRFLHQLQLMVEALGCTTLLLAQGDPDATDPVHTMVDGAIALGHRPLGLRTTRDLMVHKFRGSAFLEGRHPLRITAAGMVVYPRIEALLAAAGTEVSVGGLRDTVGAVAAEAEAAAAQDVRLSLGVPPLDAMLGGGLPAGTLSVLLGAPGSGKTLLGLHVLAAGAAAGERGLYLGFKETTRRLLAKASRIGLDLQAAVSSNQLQVLWEPPLEPLLEPLAARLLDAVRAGGVQRVVIDGLEGLARAAQPPERLAPFLTALSLELEAQGVTTVLTAELARLWGPEVILPFSDVMDVADNLVFLRFVELHSQLYRLVSILKARDSSSDPAIREFRITDQGIEVADVFASAEAILTGVARPFHPLRPSRMGPQGRAEDLP